MEKTEFKTIEKAKKLIKLEKGQDEVVLPDRKIGKDVGEYFVRQNCTHPMGYEIDELIDGDTTYKLSICLECEAIKIYAFDSNNNDKLLNYLNKTIIYDNDFITKKSMFSLATYEYEKFVRETEAKKICAGEAINKCESSRVFKLEFDKRFNQGITNGNK